MPRTSGDSGGGGGSEAAAAALTWKLEAEKAMREGERWKAAARRSDELVHARDTAHRIACSFREARRDHRPCERSAPRSTRAGQAKEAEALAARVQLEESRLAHDRRAQAETRRREVCRAV